MPYAEPRPVDAGDTETRDENKKVDSKFKSICRGCEEEQNGHIAAVICIATHVGFAAIATQL